MQSIIKSKTEEKSRIIPYPNESGFLPTIEAVDEVKKFAAEMRHKSEFIKQMTIGSIQCVLEGIGKHEIEYALEIV